MAQDIVSGLFGLSPYETQMQQRAEDENYARTLATMNPQQMPAYFAAKVGQGLGGMLNSAMGLEDPRQQQAQQRYAQLQGLDPSSSQSLLAKAQQVSDPKLKMQLTLLARQREAEERKASLDEFKIRDEAMFRRQEREQQRADKMEIAKEQINARIEQAKLRSEDTRLGIQQRADAAKEANALRMQLAQMAADSRLALQQAKGLQGNVEKPMTAEQDRKLRVLMGKDRQMVGQVESDAEFLDKAIGRLEKHPGLPSMTGWQSYLPSAPESPVTSGQAKAAETILNEIRGRTATLGRQIASQSGKLGNMAVQEWKIVSDSLAALDPASSEFKNQLQNLRAQLRGLEARVKESYATTYEPYLEKMPEFGLGTIPRPNATVPQSGNDLAAAARAELAKRKGAK